MNTPHPNDYEPDLDDLDVATTLADEDPTSWCNACGAMRQADCHCGPLADNE